jgi:hypothetical protein
VTFNFLPDLGIITADVDTTPGHAATFADWLLDVNASTTRGKIDLVGTKAHRHRRGREASPSA